MRALPTPDAQRRSAFRAPRTAIEVRIAAIWEETMKLKRVGVDDDFLELGGHSLVAVRIVARLAKAFSREIPLRAVFDAPTVAQLARLVEENPSAARDGD